MAEVFISYKRERQPAAEHLAKVFEIYGFKVWFDYGLVAGQDFAIQLESEIRRAKAVVVLWCRLSVGSRWVLEEADLALTLGALVPVVIETVELPLGFRRSDAVDLKNWNGSPRAHDLDRLLSQVSQRVGRQPALNFEAARNYEEAWRRFGEPSLLSFRRDRQASDFVESPRLIRPVVDVPAGSLPPAAPSQPVLDVAISGHDLRTPPGELSTRLVRTLQAPPPRGLLSTLEAVPRAALNTFQAVPCGLLNVLESRRRQLLGIGSSPPPSRREPG